MLGPLNPRHNSLRRSSWSRSAASSGTVNVDEGYAPTWGSTAAPMGGMGVSGVGRRHGAEGLIKYTEPQTVATTRVMNLGGPRGLPAIRIGSPRIVHRSALRSKNLERWTAVACWPIAATLSAVQLFKSRPNS